MKNPIPLPVPFKYNGKGIIAVEYDRPDVGTIADTKLMAKENIWLATARWISGSVIAYITDDDCRIEDKSEIRSITKLMPMQSSEVLAIAVALLFNDNDLVEGVYICPRCDTPIIAEEKDGYDTRDSISDMEIIVSDGIEESITINLAEEIIIKRKSKTTKEQMDISIRKIEMKHPNINHGISAWGRFGTEDTVRQQYAYYVEALLKIDDEEVSPRERAEYGMMIFEKIKNKDDIKALSDAVSKYGIDNTVKKKCRKCNKIWEEEINTSSFFASALQ